MVNQASSNYNDYSQETKFDVPQDRTLHNDPALKLAMGVLSTLRNDLQKIDIPWDRSISVSKDYASDKADKIDAFVNKAIERVMQTYSVPLTAVLPDGKTTLLEWAIKNEKISNEALEGLLIAGIKAHPEDKEVILQIISEHQ